MNKSLNAQHAEIYKLHGDLNECWKTLKMKEKNIQYTIKKSDPQFQMKAWKKYHSG